MEYQVEILRCLVSGADNLLHHSLSDYKTLTSKSVFWKNYPSFQHLLLRTIKVVGGLRANPTTIPTFRLKVINLVCLKF